MGEHKWRASAIIWTGCGENYSRALHTDTNTCSNCEGQFHLQFLPVHFNFVISNQSASPLLWHKGNYTSKLQQAPAQIQHSSLSRISHTKSTFAHRVSHLMSVMSFSVSTFPRQEANRTYAHQLLAVLWKIQRIYFASSRGISKLAVMSFSQSKQIKFKNSHYCGSLKLSYS